MTRHSHKQPKKLDINDSLAQLSVKKPDATDKCRADLLESIRRTNHILCRFEKHLDYVSLLRLAQKHQSSLTLARQ